MTMTNEDRDAVSATHRYEVRKTMRHNRVEHEVGSADTFSAALVIGNYTAHLPDVEKVVIYDREVAYTPVWVGDGAYPIKEAV